MKEPDAYALSANELMIIKRALEFYTLNSQDAKIYLRSAEQLHSTFRQWYVQALCN